MNKVNYNIFDGGPQGGSTMGVHKGGPQGGSTKGVHMRGPQRGVRVFSTPQCTTPKCRTLPKCRNSPEMSQFSPEMSQPFSPEMSLHFKVFYAKCRNILLSKKNLVSCEKI